MIGIIGAMPEEVEGIHGLMTDVTVHRSAGLEVVCGRLGANEAAVVCCGVGKVNAAICAQILISEYHVDCLINSGVAGGLMTDLHKGDIVLSTEARYHDYDVSPLGLAPGEMMGMQTSVFQADERLLQLALECCGELFPERQYRTGRIVSGDQFITGTENQTRLREVWGGTCAEMEGAAIAHTAYLNQIPYLIVRAISDGADDDSPMDFLTFKAHAIENSVKLIERLAARI